VKLITQAALTFAKIGERVELECSMLDYIEGGYTGDYVKIPVTYDSPFEYVTVHPSLDVPRGELRHKVKLCRECKRPL
jgi:hypothetical protein